MSGSKIASVVSVLPVTDHAAAVGWYQKWVGRAPDVVPTDGVAEWQLAENAWIQVSVNPESSGRTTVVIGVENIEAQRSACAAAGIVVGEIQDFGVVKISEAVDPAGNMITFAQEVS